MSKIHYKKKVIWEEEPSPEIITFTIILIAFLSFPICAIIFEDLGKLFNVSMGFIIGIILVAYLWIAETYGLFGIGREVVYEKWESKRK